MSDRRARVDLSADPLVYFIDDFADEDSCDHLIRQARPSLGGAEVQTLRGSASHQAIRRASSCWLAARGDEALEHLEDAICAELGAPEERTEFFHVVRYRAAKESEIPNFKGSDLGRFPLVSADFWTSDHLSERSRSMDAFSGTRARGTLTLKRR